MSYFETYKNLHVLSTTCLVLTATVVALSTSLLDLLRRLHKGLILLPCILVFSLCSKAQSIGCDGFGYLVQTTGSPTKQYLIQIDIASGVSEIVDNENLPGTILDGMGFNPIDGNLWGSASDSSVFVFRGPSTSITFATYPITGLPPASYNSGDISYNGVLYLYNSGSSAIQEVDVNPSSPTYLTYLGALPVTPMNIEDYSFNSIDSSLYTVTSGGATHDLIKINPTTGVETIVGSIAGLAAGDSYGAMYFDASGNMFIQSNTTGKIFQINSASTTSAPFATFITTTVRSSNQSDGARCNVTTLLPVKLVSFAGVESGSTTVLTWQTAEEIDSKEFIVEYSPDNNGKDFKAIDTVAASGNSFGDTYSSLYDAPNGIGYYRLKIVDLDGTYTYSNIVVMQTTNAPSAHISLYPNPAKDLVIVRGLESNDQVTLIDMTGRPITSSSTTDDAKQIDISNYPSGMYMVQVVRAGQIVTNLKLAKE
ncbi:MAG TPA: T9SS type A sorting domain-containing protein [Ferruginibacter sp.]|nr:T9SS type A sorting domain-containing protein [Ferruginibacter sp.]